MEFDGVLGGEFGGGEDAEGFEDNDDAGAVVVGSGAAGGGGATGGVEMRADYVDICARAGDAGYDAGLVVGVCELGDGDCWVCGCDGFDGVE